MGTTIRQPKLIAIAAGVTTAQTVPFAPTYDPNTQRLIVGTMNASDSIALNIVAEHTDDSGVLTTVTALAETFTGSTSFTYTLNGPIQKITLQKTGTNGAASIIIVG